MKFPEEMTWRKAVDQVIAFLCTIQFVIQFEIINIEHDQCGWLLMLAYMVNTFKCVFAVVQRSKVIGNRCSGMHSDTGWHCAAHRRNSNIFFPDI